MGTKISDIWKVGTIAPLPEDLDEVGSMAVDVTGKKLYFLDNLGALFAIGGDGSGTVKSVNSVDPDVNGNVHIDAQTVGAAWETHGHTISSTAGLQAALDGKFDESDHISISVGSADAGKPIILSNSGQVDPSMIDTNAFSPVAPWTPVAGNEYPDTTTSSFGDFWWIEGVTEDPDADSYTFVDVGGDLEGRTITNGDFMVWGTEGWGIMIGEMNPLLYYKLDGTSALTADFEAGGFKLSNLTAGALTSDAATKGQMDAALLLNLDLAGTRVMVGDLKVGTLTEALPEGSSNKIVGVRAATEVSEASTYGQLISSFVLGTY